MPRHSDHNFTSSAGTTISEYQIGELRALADEIAHIATSACFTPWSCVAYKDQSDEWQELFSTTQLPFSALRVHFDRTVQGQTVYEVANLNSSLSAVRSNNPVFYAGAPIADEKGQNIGVLCVFDAKERTLSASQRDTLTAITRIASRLVKQSAPTSESESFYRLKKVYENAPVGLIELNENLCLTAANPAFCKMLETTESTILGRSIFTFTHPDDVKASKEIKGNAERDGTTKVEKRYVTDSGKTVYVKVTAKILNISKGHSSFMSCVEDITKIKEVENQTKALKEELVFEQQKIKQIVDLMDEGLVLHDGQGKVSYFNPAALRVLGLTENQLLGKSGTDLGWRVICEDGSTCTPDQHPSSIARREMRHIKGALLGVVLPSGGLRWLRVSANPFFNRDTQELMVAVTFTDVTDGITAQKDLELERVKSLRNAKLASLGEMSAGIAHEINNPLAIIQGMVYTLANSIGDREKFDKKVESINKAVARIAKIVKGLRKFSRSADRSHYKTCVLQNIIEESLTLIDAKSKKHSVAIQVHSKDDLNVRCDDVEIEQVLVNLINNSIDAIRSMDNPWISIHVFSLLGGAVIQIRDCGHGIDDDIQTRLFQPFFTTKPPGEGTGLGLSIVKGILDEHGASIELLTSEKNTCFEIRFPKAEADTDAA